MIQIGRLLMIPALAFGLAWAASGCSMSVSVNVVESEPIQVDSLSRSAVLLTVDPVAQGSAYDCGLAAVGAVAQYYGRPLDPDSVVELRAMAESKQSLTVGDMTAALELAGMDVYAFKGDLGPTVRGIPWHLNAGRPCIVLVKRTPEASVGHFLVVCGYDPEKQWMVIADSKHGIVAITIADFQRVWENASTVLMVAAPSAK
jgi:ABC-type bacteriocin/lantibiotic exporter with double-glycine peptidase domain